MVTQQTYIRLTGRQDLGAGTRRRRREHTPTPPHTHRGTSNSICRPLCGIPNPNPHPHPHPHPSPHPSPTPNPTDSRPAFHQFGMRRSAPHGTPVLACADTYASCIHRTSGRAQGSSPLWVNIPQPSSVLQLLPEGVRTSTLLLPRTLAPHRRACGGPRTSRTLRGIGLYQLTTTSSLHTLWMHRRPELDYSPRRQSSRHQAPKAPGGRQ